MPQQPEIPSSSFALSPAPRPSPPKNSVGDSLPNSDSNDNQEQAEPHPPQRIPHWLVRTELFLRIMLWMYFGLFMCYLPWSGRFFSFFPLSHLLWDNNPLWGVFPWLAKFAENGAVRGIVSGLGLLNLWMAFQHAIRHRDE